MTSRDWPDPVKQQMRQIVTAVWAAEDERDSIVIATELFDSVSKGLISVAIDRADDEPAR
jgi:hypothetical protein